MNDNVFLGLTSMPGDGGPLTYIDDFDAAFADARWSQFSTVLQPGLYNLTGIATEAPLGGGVGGIRLSELPPAASVIPVPGALGLMLSGIALVGCALRTRRSNA
ncbi:MAG: hypothetical protein H7125_16480 [Proteobacteria bacterium]|nr:hypothetical protein [Burkholderiales bacterium]